MFDFETAACHFRKEAFSQQWWRAQTNTPILTEDKHEETGRDYLGSVKRTIERQHISY